MNNYCNVENKEMSLRLLTLSEVDCLIRCIENFFSSILISDTSFLLYFLILRQVCFIAFFDLSPPSFANFMFCKMEFCNVGIGTKMADFQGRNIFWRQITAFWSRMDAIDTNCCLKRK